jgi:pantothenate kinase type III
VFTSSPLPSDMFELDVAAPTSSCPAKGIVSTVATAAKTTWEKARSESMVSVDSVLSGGNAQLSLGERVGRSNPHGFLRREAQSEDSRRQP